MNMRRIFTLICAATLILVTINPGNIAGAATKSDFFTSNDINMYTPGDVGCNTSPMAPTGGNSDIKHKIPATKGKAGLEEAINEQGKVPSGGTITFSKFASKGQEYRDYYITMRWDYVAWNWNGTSESFGDDGGYFEWMNEAPRIVHVTNPRTGKSIYAAAIEAGPQPWAGVDTSDNNIPKQGWTNPQRGTPEEYKGRVSGFPPTAFDYLEIKQGTADGSGDDLVYEWAKDQNVKPGPTNQSASGGNGCNGPGANGWDLPEEGPHPMVFFDQCDPRWANINPVSGSSNGAFTHCKCSCGPFSMSMIIATLNNDPNFDPSTFTVKMGMDLQPGGCGSVATLWKSIASENNLNIHELGFDIEKARGIINQGGLVLFLWSGGPFTSGGHYMVIRGFNGNKVYIASSAGTANYEQSKYPWDINIFKNGFTWPTNEELPGMLPGRMKSGGLVDQGGGGPLWGFTK